MEAVEQILEKGKSEINTGGDKVNKERLDAIKIYTNTNTKKEYGFATLISYDDAMWLIEQAERKQDLEKDVKRYRKLLDETLSDILENDEMYITNEEIINDALRELDRIGE